MKPTATPYSFEHANEAETSVQGVRFLVWQNYARRGTFAQNTETGEVRRIQSSGYITRDLTVRKAIASSFGLASFRK